MSLLSQLYLDLIKFIEKLSILYQINGRPIYISSIYMFVYFSVYLSQLLTCIEFEMGMASSLQ